MMVGIVYWELYTFLSVTALTHIRLQKCRNAVVHCSVARVGFVGLGEFRRG